MQATLNINYAHNNTTVAATQANAMVRKEATQKIIMFVAILVCLVAAVNL